MNKVEELLVFISKELVRHPDEVEVCVFEDEDRMRYQVVVADEDLGRIIGKGGKTAKAFRELATKLAYQLNEPRPTIEFRNQTENAGGTGADEAENSDEDSDDSISEE